MKYLAVGLFVGAMTLTATSFAQVNIAPPTLSDSAAGNSAAQVPESAPVTAQKPLSANEAAGLPDLNQINRPAGTASSKVELNTVRTPSYHQKERDGTEVTEYRDRGKPTEIDVRSSFGTHYQMSNPTDASPRVPSNGAPNGRVPSIHLSY